MLLDISTIYNYTHLEMKEVKASTILQMIEDGWVKDLRSTTRTVLLHKFFKVESVTYKIVIRFSKGTGFRIFNLDLPAPFMITEVEELPMGYRDIKVYHGKTLNGIIGYLQSELPVSLLDDVHAELKRFN